MQPYLTYATQLLRSDICNGPEAIVIFFLFNCLFGAKKKVHSNDLNLESFNQIYVQDWIFIFFFYLHALYTIIVARYMCIYLIYLFIYEL